MSSQLAALNAVTPGYPLRGHVRIADTPFGVARATDRIPGRGEVWIDARIMAQLKIALGSPLENRRRLVPGDARCSTTVRIRARAS